jgi:hypothetical protein
MNADCLPSDIREWALTIDQFFNLGCLLYRHLRAAGRPGRRRPRDATAGVAVFLRWETGVRLVNLEQGDVPLGLLLKECQRLEAMNRELRRTIMEVEREGSRR